MNLRYLQNIKKPTTGKASNLCEKPSDSCLVRPSECSHHEQQEQKGNGKIREISSDETRLSELITELTEKAARPEQHTEISAEEGDSDETESLSSNSESAHSQESEIKFGPPNTNPGVASDRTDHRLSFVNNKNSDDIARYMAHELKILESTKIIENQ